MVLTDTRGSSAVLGGVVEPSGSVQPSSGFSAVEDGSASHILIGPNFN